MAMIKPKLDNEMLSRIVAIERYRERAGMAKLPVRISSRLRKNSRKRSSYASLKIEGNPLSEEAVGEAIDSARRHFLKPEQEVRNYYAALTFLADAAAKKIPFSKSLILDVQRIVVRGEPVEKTGIRGPMPPGVLFAVYDEKTGVPEYIPPEAGDINGLLDELVEYVANSDDHSALKAAVVHYQLVTIHPFEDGNGRTARLMSGYLLDLTGYGFNNIGSLEEYFAYDIEEYYRSLQMGLPPLFYDGRENPPHPEIWLKYFLRMMELYAQKVSELANSAQGVGTEASVTHLGLKERRFWEYLKRERIDEFAPSELAGSLKVTNRTVINWCAALAKNGLLEPCSSGSRVRSYRVVADSEEEE